MFGSLKKKLQESVKKLAKKAESKKEKPKKPGKKQDAGKAIEREITEEIFDHEAEKAAEAALEKKPGLRERLVKKVREKELSEDDLENFFREELELDLLQNNVALEVADFLKSRLKEDLADTPLKRGKAKETVRKSFENSLLEIVDQGRIDLKSLPKKTKPVTLLFLGFNGSGKTTSIAKVAKYLKDRNYQVVLAAGDTFRAASIEQLEVHASKLDLKVIKQDYGADSAAVIFDARKYAEAKGIDFVLADTAGRSHADANLMDELRKVVRVNKPDLKILVVDSLTGNDAVEQARAFHQAVGVDAVLMTKLDVNEKGGSILSVSWAIKKPVLFMGTGQEYKDLKLFEPEKFVKGLLE